MDKQKHALVCTLASAKQPHPLLVLGDMYVVHLSWGTDSGDL